jgi:amino-acid N-acetyltransferase
VAAQVIIEGARPDDAAAMTRLVAQSGLPLDGLRDALATALVARADGQVVGTAALERYEDGALLRSVAVETGWRGRGLGGRLTEAATELARTLDAPAVYLLTTTAERFFSKYGFVRIERSDVPSSVQSSIEFTQACPASAIVMVRPIRDTESFRIQNSEKVRRDPW